MSKILEKNLLNNIFYCIDIKNFESKLNLDSSNIEKDLYMRLDLYKSMIKYLTPKISERSSENYLSLLKTYNKLNHIDAINRLKVHMPQLNNSQGQFAIVTTGSDGRYEKSCLSLIEIILLHNGSQNVESIEKQLSRTCANEDILDSCSEVKNVQCDSVCYFQNFEDRVFPTRALDSLFLMGNYSLYKDYRLKFFNELSSEGKDSKRKIRKFDDKRRFFRKIINTGKDSRLSVPSFDLDSGKLYFDGNMIKSTKYAHLRGIQYKLASDIFKYIFKQKMSIDVFENLPRGTIGKLEYVHSIPKMGNLGMYELDDLISTYKTALHFYHLSEENFMKGRDITKVDKKLLQEVTEISSKFVNRKSIFN